MRNAMSYRVVLLNVVALGLLPALQGCAGEDPTSGRDADRAPATAAASPEVATAADSGSAVAASDSNSIPVDANEAEQAARHAAAQSYMDRARADAEERHRLGLEHCRSKVAADFEACVATADESLQAELRAARVEFDAQMMQAQ